MLVLLCFFGLLLIGLPVGYVLGIAGMIGMYQIGGMDFMAMAAQRFFAGLDLFTFMAMPFFILAGLIYSLGYILIGMGIMQTGTLPWYGGLLLAIGAPAFGLGSLFGKLQVYPRTLGVTLLSVGLIWLGLGMIAT